jgi:hypothetical protein
MTSRAGRSALRQLEWGAAGLLSLFMVWVHGERLAHAGAMWRDEAAAVNLATLPSLRDVYRLFPHEAFPLAVPLSIRLYARVAGDSDAALRGFGMAIGLALAGALWVSARAAGRTLPLLSLALLGSSAPFVVFGDSLRGYGLGSLCIVLGFAALAWLLARPAPWPAAAALIALIGAVQCLLGNAALVAALCVAAAVAALAGGLRRVAMAAMGCGLAAALSLLPYAAPLRAAGSWNVVVVYHAGLVLIARVLLAALGPAAWVWLPLIALAVVGTAWELARGRRSPAAGDAAPMPSAAARTMTAPADRAGESAAGGVSRDVRLFAVLAIIMGIAAQLWFLDFLAYTPRAWYDLPLLALVACALEPLVAGLGRAARFRGCARWVRLALALLLAGAMLPSELPRLRMRMTNADLVAGRLAAEAAAGDLVVVSPWYFGVSFQRYYHGPAAWVTLPDISDHTIHRYDLLKARLASARPIDDVLASVRRTLAAGRRVWLVGQLRVPPRDQAPPVFPPAPATPWGWNDYPYGISWGLQLGALLRDHAGSLAVVPVPAADPVSSLERLTLAVASGWRSGEMNIR